MPVTEVVPVPLGKSAMLALAESLFAFVAVTDSQPHSAKECPTYSTRDDDSAADFVRVCVFWIKFPRVSGFPMFHLGALS